MKYLGIIIFALIMVFRMMSATRQRPSSPETEQPRGPWMPQAPRRPAYPPWWQDEEMLPSAEPQELESEGALPVAVLAQEISLPPNEGIMGVGGSRTGGNGVAGAPALEVLPVRRVTQDRFARLLNSRDALVNGILINEILSPPRARRTHPSLQRR
ncbi:MAG: hypothetical protein ACYCX4_04980 [Bacillota bacterium]